MRSLIGESQSAQPLAMASGATDAGAGARAAGTHLRRFAPTQVARDKATDTRNNSSLPAPCSSMLAIS